LRALLALGVTTLQGRPVTCETVAEAAGADSVLVLSSTCAGIVLRSVFVGVEGAESSYVLHVLQTRRPPPAIEVFDRPAGELPVTHARALCVHEHAARLHDLLADELELQVRIDVDAAAAAIVDVYPRP
jgi:hypothetical protein